MITRNFNLYLNAGHSVPLVINVNQYDSGEQWVFTLYNADGTQYTPSTGAIVGIKADGLGIINSGSVVDGKVVINETQQMTAAVGKAVFELTIDSGTHGTANFVVLVEEKPGNNADLSDSDLSLIQEALDAVNPLPTGGSVGQVLTKTANGSTWSDAGTPTQEQVADAVSDWADEHITVSTGVVIDTSLAVAGAAADSKKVGDEITDLKSAIERLDADILTRSVNLLNPSNITVGKFYKVELVDNKGVIVQSNNNAYACAWIEVKKGTQYAVTGTDYNSFNADDDGNAIGIAAYNGETVFDTTTTNSNYGNTGKLTTRVYFSWRIADYPINTYMAVEGDTVPQTYSEYNISLNEGINVSYNQLTDVPEGAPEVYTVDLNGGGDYTSFTACLEDLADNQHDKIIYVKPGVYDVFDEIGGAAYASSISNQGYGWFDVSVVVPPKTKIIGIGEVTLQFKPTAEQIPTDVMSLLSPVNVVYDIYMENITIDCDNCRYGIHDETGHIEGVIGTRHIYKNVNIKKLRTDGGMDAAFGCGMQKSQYMEFECCNFYSQGRPFSFHNKGTQPGDYIDDTIIVIKNCVSNPYSGSPARSALRFGNVNGKQVKIDVRVFNTYLGGIVLVEDESTVARPNAYNLTFVGCGNPTITITSETNIYQPTVFQI